MSIPSYLQVVFMNGNSQGKNCCKGAAHPPATTARARMKGPKYEDLGFVFTFVSEIVDVSNINNI
jgi:hypothetical protein